MDSETCLTILGGLISGLVGVSLFFLQRSRAGHDEQQNLLFRIYQIIAIPGRPEITRDRMITVASEMRIFNDEQKEIHSLALLLKDRDLAAKIYRFNLRIKDEREALLKELERRLNPRLLKLIDEEKAKTEGVASEKTSS
jgi:hypothetical protein